MGQPLLFLLALGFGLGSVFQRAGEGNYIVFLVPGIIAMSVLFTALFSGMEIIWDRRFGFLKETLVAPVSRLEIMIGRTFGGATVAVIQGLIVLGISFFMGFRPIGFWALLLGLIFMCLVALLFSALGVAIASALDDMQGFQLIMNFLVMPLFFLSGAIFPLQDLPPAMSVITRLDPLSYGVDGMRGALTNAYHFGLPADLLVLIILTGVCLIIGSILFAKTPA